MLAGANYITVHKVASLFLRIAIDKTIHKLKLESSLPLIPRE